MNSTVHSQILFRRIVWIAPLAAALIIVATPRAFCAGEAALLEQRLPSHSILKASPEELAAAVAAGVRQAPRSAGLYMKIVLGSGRPDADAVAPEMVRAALGALGKEPSGIEIADVLRSAIKTAPTEVLEIVPVAIKAVPRSQAKTVVAVAAASVPDPQKMVTLEGEKRTRLAGDGKSDGKSDGKEVEAPGKRMTLAEAIVTVAMEADPQLSAEMLTTAVDNALSIQFTVSRRPELTDVLTPGIAILPIEPRTPPLPEGRVDAPNPGVTSP